MTLQLSQWTLDAVVLRLPAGVICEAEDWVGIAAFGRAKAHWLSQFLELDNGIPSDDNFGWGFSLLAPSEFETYFRAWADSIRRYSPARIPLDLNGAKRSFGPAR